MKNFCEINRKFMPILLQIIGAYGQDVKDKIHFPQSPRIIYQ